MKDNITKLLKGLALLLTAFSLLTACNKEMLDATPVTPPAPPAQQTIAELLNAANFSLLKEAATRAGLLEALGNRDALYTVFAPDNDAFQRSGIGSAQIQGLPIETLRAILRYHIVPGQRITSAMIPTTFPNMQLPTLIELVPPGSIPTGLRMSIFPSKRGNNAWVNNIPLVAVDVLAANGVIHRVAGIVAPAAPQMLWNRIDTDPNLTYLKAAIQRADQASTSANLVALLGNGGANFTVFAPNDASMQQFLIGSIAQAFMAQGFPPAAAQGAASVLVSTYGTTIISNPASIPDAPLFPAGTNIGAQLAAVLTARAVQGIVLYHLLGSRAFTVNLPATATLTPTLLNNGIPAHPGVGLQATLGMTGMATAATAKGIANPTASNLLINPTPAPNGTSDQNYINGVLHVIDQMLRPQ